MNPSLSLQRFEHGRYQLYRSTTVTVFRRPFDSLTVFIKGNCSSDMEQVNPGKAGGLFLLAPQEDLLMSPLKGTSPNMKD
jgi:hypothetical protein